MGRLPHREDPVGSVHRPDRLVLCSDCAQQPPKRPDCNRQQPIPPLALDLPYKKRGPIAWASLKMLVGARGFEPPTPRSRTECSTRLSHAPTTDPVYRNP